jgi:hypothetical protein
VGAGISLLRLIGEGARVDCLSVVEPGEELALAGYADTSSHGRVRFVISLTSNDGETRFRLLRAIESGL